MTRHKTINPLTGRRVLKTAATYKKAMAMLKSTKGMTTLKKKKSTMCMKGNCTKKNMFAHSVKPLFKGVKGGGQRLSAASYFKYKDSKLKNCEPQWILQPNGKVVLKKIAHCKDAWGGQCVKWVKV
jgi:hypothetical protein